MMVFLGGTVNGSKWREELILKLKIDYFNPIVDKWDDEARMAEEEAKLNCDYLLFVITPKFDGFYSIAELVDASNKFPQKTIFCVLDSDGDSKWTAHQIKSLNQIRELVELNGGCVLDGLDEVAEFLNAHSFEV